ncbi:MAG TPA: CHRD domain-containing protein [Candidatus Binatia bacterium]|nr:CHRD domain-containing protein [Candidatus Binatia bacterium]
MQNGSATGTQFATELSGYNEVIFSGGGSEKAFPVPAATLRGAISTKATGKFSATLNTAGDIIDYELSYSGLEADVTQAHIHFGQRHTVGGIVVWLCQTAANPAPESVRDEKITPLCPGPRDGSVKGTITADQVLAVTGQGIAAREFDELVRALQNRAGYANVHTRDFPQGEIRGQIRVLDENVPTQTLVPFESAPQRR